MGDVQPRGPEKDGPDPAEAVGPASSPDTSPGRWTRRLTRPTVLFPVIALLALSALWIGTLNLSQGERRNAHLTARASSQELLDTYEAQVVRVVREIDRTLKSLQYAYQIRGDGEGALSDLDERGLLPPDLVFTVSLADENGRVMATTQHTAGSGYVDPSFLRQARAGDSLFVSRPARESSGEWRLGFSRGLTAPDGSFGGVAVVEVDASFFVSGYETSKLGRRGVLGILGTDGIFRARRTGDRVAADGWGAYGSVVQEQELADSEAVLSVNSWDGVRRYTSVRRLYDFPLAVVVGLSREEQLAPAEARAATYLERAAGGSVLLILVIAALGRTSWKLEKARQREREAGVAHARRVEHMAYHDGLTGLPNRSFLGKLLERAISEARRYDRKLAVLFLDLDGFKQINDTLGHDTGDQLLTEVSERLERILRESDTVARMGGDEFVVLLPEVECEEQVATVADKVLSTLRDPFVLLGQAFRVTGSIGISLFPRNGEDEQALLKNADIAMYRAKDAGKNDFRFFADEMGAASLERLDLESSLRRALKNEEFELHYQARRELRTGRITGMEALLRLEHPEFGTVEPLRFLPLAEETGLIVPIGRWVLKTACRQNVAWQEEGLPRVSVAVNLSARQFFHDALFDDVASALEESRMDPELLELEICESVLARDARRTVPILERLKEMGVKITIDNFGTGYSSLSMLRSLSLDTIKIDRRFIRDGGTDRTDRDITDAIVAIGRSLGSSLVAQGVETREQADFLQGLACDQVQGFYYNRPVSADDCARLLRTDGERGGVKMGGGVRSSGSRPG